MKEIIDLQNPWWQTGEVPEEELGEFKRDIFEELVKELENKKITGLVGPRQAGKTTLVKQLIRDLLGKKIKPERIVYAQFETKKLCKEGIIKEVLDLVSDRLGEPLREFSDPVYLFLDEVQHLDSWAEEAKEIYDLKLKIKIFITGSSSLKILKGSGESLVGRISHHALLPLSFREIAEEKWLVKKEEILSLSYNKLKQIEGRLSPYLPRIRLKLREYLLKGGYPEVIKERSLKKAFRLLRDYKTLTLQRDLFEEEEIRNSKNISELVEVLSDLVGDRLNYSKIASILGVKMDTAKKYIGLLEDVFLIKELKVFSKKPYLSVRKERKIYFLDNGMINALSLNLALSDTRIPKLIENSVSLLILRLLYQYSIDPTYYYWFEGEETDLIIKIGEKILPIEIKYKNNVSEKELKGLFSFIEKFKLKKGVVITKDLLDEKRINGKDILFIPVWLFLIVV